jgi:hypothetical protein
MNDIWNKLLDEAKRIVASDSDPIITYGRELMDVPEDLAALTTVAIKTPELVAEVRLCDEAARPPFEWVAEITLRGSEYKHYLLRPDQTTVETYGKQVNDVTEPDAERLLDTLQNLAS